MKYLKSLAIAVIVCSAMFAAQSANAGFGISPAKLENSRLLKGMVWEQTINVSRSPEVASQELVINVNIEGDEIKNLVALTGGAAIRMNAGMTKLPVPLKVTVPADAKPGIYKGSIIFNSVPEDLASGTAGASTKPLMSAKAAVILTVTDKAIEDFRVEAISVPKIETGEPITINYRINNLGNTVAPITRISAQIIKYRKPAEVLQTAEINEPREAAPFSLKNFTEKIPVALEPKMYGAVLIFYNGERAVKKTEVGFEVAPKGSMLGGKMQIFKLDKNHVRVGESVTATAQFKNTGEKDVTAKLLITISDDDGQEIQKIETKEVEVKAKDIAEFSVPITPEKYGTVKVAGKVLFNGLESDAPAADLSVGLSVSAITVIIIGALFGAALLAFLIKLFIKK